jgi:hypothetical protein
MLREFAVFSLQFAILHSYDAKLIFPDTFSYTAQYQEVSYFVLFGQKAIPVTGRGGP